MSVEAGGRNIRIMGIVNLTDDSFYAPSRMFSPGRGVDVGRVLETVAAMTGSGADIIDLGACSSRPGSRPLGAEAEWERLGKILPYIRREFPGVTLSIDTSHSRVIQRCFDAAGSVIVNDISSGRDDPQMLPLAGRLGLTFIAMHMRGTPATMDSLTDYDDVVEEVLRFFEGFSARAAEAGVKDWIADPGFGFAKTRRQNYALLARLEDIRSRTGRPVLAGLSRKRMIYELLDTGPQECLPAVQALNMAALERGADILRVHDTAEAVQTARLYKALVENKK